MASVIFARVRRIGNTHLLIRASSRRDWLTNLSDGLNSISRAAGTGSSINMNQIFSRSLITSTGFQRLWFSSTASTQPTEEINQYMNQDDPLPDASAIRDSTDSAKANGDSSAPEQERDSALSSVPGQSESSSIRRGRRRRRTKRTAFSDSDTERDLSSDDLIKLVAEKEKLLKLKHREIEKMQDKIFHSYAEMENVIDRTKRDAENSKKFAIQNFSKGLLDVADNLGRASSVVKESFLKIDSSQDSVGAVPLLKSLLEGVEMTEKQLTEVLKKFGVEKFDPLNEHFDPNRHNAVFQIPDASKPPGTVTSVLKPGYMLYDRIIRPAEVGVTQASEDQSLDA